MTFYAGPEYYKNFSPGSPAPISFGMGNNPSLSMSLNPGAGSTSTDILGYNLSSSGPSGGQSSGQSAQPGSALPGAQSAQNMAPVNVQGYSPPSFGLSALGSLYSNSPASGSVAPDPGGVSVKNLAPVKVQAQMPVKPSMLDQLWMWKNDHPFLGNIAQGVLGNIPLLGPVMVAANAYENFKHGKGMINGVANMFHPSTQDAPSAPSFPGGPLGTNAQNPLYANLYQSPILGDGANTGDSSYISALGGGPGIASSGALPAYPGLSALSGGSAPLGGFWNQRALHDAAPVYGPYAAFGHGTPSSLPAGAQFAPAGILGA